MGRKPRPRGKLGEPGTEQFTLTVKARPLTSFRRWDILEFSPQHLPFCEADTTIGWGLLLRGLFFGGLELQFELKGKPAISRAIRQMDPYKFQDEDRREAAKAIHPKMNVDIGK